MLVNTLDTMCLETILLPGTPTSFENVCDENSGEYVIFDVMDMGEGEFCVVCEAMDVGQDSACLVVCDDLGYCDTTYLMVNVMASQPDLPVALTNIPQNRI